MLNKYLRRTNNYVYFDSVTYANLIYVLLLSIKNKVVTWNINVSKIFSKKIILLQPDELFHRDEWLLKKDECHKLWKDRVFPDFSEKYNSQLNYKNNKINLSVILWQILGNFFNRLFFFTSTVIRHNKNNNITNYSIVVPWYFLFLDRQLVAELFPDVKLKYSKLGLFSDFIHEYLLSMAYIARELMLIAFSLCSRKKYSNPIKIFWQGVSPQEIPQDVNSLNFAWAVMYGQLDNKDVLYFLPNNINEKQRDYLKKNNINFVEFNEQYKLLTIASSLKIFFILISITILKFFKKPIIKELIEIRIFSQTLKWVDLIEIYKPKYYITTTSVSWPEKPQVAAMNCQSVKTIIWAYSANNITCTNNHINFKDTGIQRSFFESQEIWVWNNAVKDLLERRKINLPGNSTKYFTKSVMMNGDSQNLLAKPEDVRKGLDILGEGYFISVFDIPAVNKQWKMKRGGGPTLLSLDGNELFFKGIIKILENYPQVNIILKLKRDLNNIFRSYPESLKELTQPDSPWVVNRRVYILDINIDPYLPIAACDAAIGMTYTSPILVTLSCEKPGVFYDPLGNANYPSNQELKELTIQSENALLSSVRKWINGSNTVSMDKCKDIIPIINDKNIFNNGLM